MEKPTVKASVVLLVDKDGRVCLARKKQPIHHENGEISYSLGTYNGYGGKMEESDSTIFDTAIRELQDEADVFASKEDLKLVARVYFYLKKEDGSFEPFMDVSFFFLRTWYSDPKEGSEMGPPRFFEQVDIPYDEMMPADSIFFKKMFAGERSVYEVKLLGKKVEPEVKVLDEIL
ncbi:NUDIX domain-containing protein [Candidatus Gracilibacteria bacterium]|nr:NUDIX domain-containing protein [Candidatus Gracilibacteria bacterium]MCF7898477.1 NUDIX domain-containing protein [Candidatus Paceibacterota bacterium]